MGQSEITIQRNVGLIWDLLRKESETGSETPSFHLLVGR